MNNVIPRICHAAVVIGFEKKFWQRRQIHLVRWPHKTAPESCQTAAMNNFQWFGSQAARRRNKITRTNDCDCQSHKPGPVSDMVGNMNRVSIPAENLPEFFTAEISPGNKMKSFKMKHGRSEGR
jgi:hypothetical protein